MAGSREPAALLTVDQAAELTTLSSSMLRLMTRRNEPAGCVVRVGRSVRLHRGRLLQWLEARADAEVAHNAAGW